MLNIEPDAGTGEITSMTVAWSTMALTDSSGQTLLSSKDFPQAAVLDSGTTLTIIPDDIYQNLMSYFNAVENDYYGALVSCNISAWDGSIDYGFGGGKAVISVPFSELALPMQDEDGKPLTFGDGSPACQFGFDTAEDSGYITLGDTFLRSAYVVYDLEAKIVGLAPTVFNSTGSQVVEIKAGDKGSSPLGASAIPATGANVTQTATSLRPTTYGGLSHSSTMTDVEGSGATLTDSPVATRTGSVSGVTTSFAVATNTATRSTPATATTASASSTPSTAAAASERSASTLGLLMAAAALLGLL